MHTVLKLINNNISVIAIDNLNNSTSVQLKKERIKYIHTQDKNKLFRFLQLDITDFQNIKSLFHKEQFHKVIHFAACAGVRPSIENPFPYVHSNLLGFTSILECCAQYNIQHLIYASSSSVYGNSHKLPLTVGDNTDTPISFYAATKKANELMAYAFSHTHTLPTTGLRFFTVYGPWGRPDMAIYKFTKAIDNNQKILLYNNGKHKRDFTYIDDCVNAIFQITTFTPNTLIHNKNTLFNIGNNSSVDIMKIINYIEKYLHKKAIIEFTTLQPGDVENTCADINETQKKLNYTSTYSLQKGIYEFIQWYQQYKLV